MINQEAYILGCMNEFFKIKDEIIKSCGIVTIQEVF